MKIFSLENYSWVLTFLSGLIALQAAHNDEVLLFIFWMTVCGVELLATAVLTFTNSYKEMSVAAEQEIIQEPEEDPDLHIMDDSFADGELEQFLKYYFSPSSKLEISDEDYKNLPPHLQRRFTKTRYFGWDHYNDQNR